MGLNLVYLRGGKAFKGVGSGKAERTVRRLLQ